MEEIIIYVKKRICFAVLVFTIVGLMIPFVKVHGTTNFQGYVKNRANNAINGASVVLADCYLNILGFDSTVSSGYYSFDVTLNGNSPYYLSAGKDGFDSDTETVYSGGTYNFILNGPIKIAVFFWASDAINQTAINIYKSILDDEDYDRYFDYEDCSNVESVCQTIETYEFSFDTIFVYIIGHGGTNGNQTHKRSFTWFKANENSEVESITFKGYMDDWDASKKCLLVDSCYSGDWANDYNESPYLAMSSADENNIADYYNSSCEEGDFSHHFFIAVSGGYTAVGAYTYACNNIKTSSHNPQKQDHSFYTWFN